MVSLNPLLRHLTMFSVRITIVVFVTLCTIVAYMAGSLESWDMFAYDKYLALSLRTMRFTDPRILIVGIGDSDMQRFGNWPMPSKNIAELVDALKYFGARSIAFHSPLQESGYEADDMRLEQAIANAGNVYLTADFENLNINDGRKIKRSAKRFEQHAKGLGHVHVSPDPDGLIRRAKPYVFYGRETYPELGLRLAMDLYNIKPARLKMQLSQIVLPIPGEMDLTIPLTSRGDVLLNWAGPWEKTFIHVSFEDIIKAYRAALAGTPSPIQTEIFQNSICQVGITAQSYRNTVVTALESNYPEVGISATLLNSVIERRFIKAQRDFVYMITILSVTLLLLLIMTIQNRSYHSVLIIALMAVYLLLALIMLAFFRFWIGIAYPLFLSISVYGVMMLYHQVVSSFESKKLKGLATKDLRTGLINREHFRALLTAELRNIFSRRAPHLSLVMIDADHFKKVNDTYGHDAGDEVLKGIAELIQNSIRSMDVACRYGGEEFLVMLPGTNADNAKRVAEKIRMTLQDHEFKLGVRQTPYQVTASFGVAEFHRREPIQAFLERVDKALYLAKSGGRNCVCVT